MAAIDAQGVVWTLNDGAADQVIGGLDTFDFGNGSTSEKDRTTLASTGIETAPGLADGGTVELNFKLIDPADAGQAVIIATKAARTIRTLTGTFASGEVVTASVWVVSYGASGGVNADVAGTSSLRVTGGDPVWS